jgi:hypothetical protein
MLVTVPLSHAGDGVVKVTWLRRDIFVESCRQCNLYMQDKQVMHGVTMHVTIFYFCMYL